MIAVVHLVWGPLGPARLRAFLASYRGHPAGSEHELVVLFNNVARSARPEYEAELEDFDHRVVTLAEPVQDLAAYAQAPRLLEHERFCFLNSYSEVLAPDWLAKLDRALQAPEVGLVGATGSWASVRSGTMNGLFLPNPYRGVAPGRRVAREQLAAIERELAGASNGERKGGRERSLGDSIAAFARTLPLIPEQLLRFDSFPAVHLRTNGFMLGRETFERLRIGRVRRKMDAYLLESGHGSLTHQVQRLGLRVRVVARDGKAYDHEDWPLSRTLWQGDQERLLIADNQTQIYANGDIDRRRLLSAFAWGGQADPVCPGAGENEMSDQGATR